MHFNVRQAWASSLRTRNLPFQDEHDAAAVREMMDQTAPLVR
jgi:hypothetical protein